MHKTILCIDGDRARAALTAQRLTERGHAAALAYDGPQGLAAVLRLRPDIVLCNGRLPAMSGYELRDRLIALTPQFASIPFVFVGEFAGRDNHIKGRHLDVDAYVVSPLNFDVLETVIGECLAKVERTESWPRQISLTEREVECLTWAVRGKTSNEIAQIIGLIKRNVDFYIETACRKLKLGMRIQRRRPLRPPPRVTATNPG
jgi:DNA-binding NarL/FixJ family response regulator